MAINKEIIREIEESIKSLFEQEKNDERINFGDWESRFLKETNKLIDNNLKIKSNNLVNFRGKQIFVADRPKAYIKSFYNSSPIYYNIKRILDKIVGSERGSIQEAIDSFCAVKEAGFVDLLKKYPSPNVGHPLNFKYKGYVFTNRYIRHIYLLGLLKKYLSNELNGDSTFLDIGSSYGIFSSLVKQEISTSRHILVDMSGQLILAHYYLSQLFPGKKIAGFKEVYEAKEIDRDFIKRFDFILIPTSMFDKLVGNTIDVVTNFISLSEMSREWFDAYINSDVFKTAKFLYTVNRYDAYPTYQNDITILDYPLREYETIYMRTCPFLKYYYKGKNMFWYKPVRYPSEFFQFIGKNKNDN